jgi:hypothetical protein
MVTQVNAAWRPYTCASDCGTGCPSASIRASAKEGSTHHQQHPQFRPADRRSPLSRVRGEAECYQRRQAGKYYQCWASARLPRGTSIARGSFAMPELYVQAPLFCPSHNRRAVRVCPARLTHIPHTESLPHPRNGAPRPDPAARVPHGRSNIWIPARGIGDDVVQLKELGGGGEEGGEVRRVGLV